jgi:AcrR family transcriptional regulator
VIARKGVGAPTSAIAKEAGVSNGSLFLYFDSKATLWNELYVTLKAEMSATALAGLAIEEGAREQVRHVWNQWLHWATSFPEKRRALARLDVCDDITAESHRIVHAAFGDIADLLDRSAGDAGMRAAPLGFILALTSAIADATVDAMISEPDEARTTGRIAFDALWRMLA